MGKPTLHTITMTDYPWAAFAAASEGGGTPPQWTQSGPDPDTWSSPEDAAGGLILWGENGEAERSEPPCGGDLTKIADGVIDDLRGAGLTEDVIPGVVRATYASSGGRMVALVQDDACWWVAVLRTEAIPRAGASERNMRSAGHVEGYPTMVYDTDGSFD
jgi:hypothetical protein